MMLKKGGAAAMLGLSLSAGCIPQPRKSFYTSRYVHVCTMAGEKIHPVIDQPISLGLGSLALVFRLIAPHLRCHEHV